ncbi:MAG: PD-(D/E)XK nuclease family protein, partial [Planctomycetes bacterium]|nr:PD-(D/E)XK nuclease family protein [Planctomycetota bacterium]
RFNIFRALRIEKAEIRHSNVLAWLMDPVGTHGLGSIVLRRMLSSILLDAPEPVIGISPARVELMELSDVEVRREWRHIDLLVICHDDSNRFVLLIENKLLSGEHSGQLERYVDIVKQEFPDYPRIPVYLTLVGDDPSDVAQEAGYVVWTHVGVLQMLETLVEQRASQLTSASATFLNHYLEVLRGLTMQDDQLIDLCKSIYRKHREAIDLILDYGKVDVFQQVTEDCLSKNVEFEVLFSEPRSVWFLPRSLLGIAPKGLAPGPWQKLSHPSSVACWFRRHEQSKKIRLVFETCKMADPELRMGFVTALRDAGFKLTKLAFEPTATFSRFYGPTHTADLDDPESVRDAVENLLKKAKDGFVKMERVCKEVFST